MRYTKLIQFLFIASVLFISCQKAEKSTQPNIVYVFPDQYRQFSLGFWSQGDNAKHIQGNPDPVITPALDKLANEGIVFSRAMSNFPLCSPYRGMLLTGRYPHQNGLIANCHKNRTVGIIANGESIANVLYQSGYETAYFGKCHWQRTEPLFDQNGTFRGTSEEPGGYFINAFDTYVPPGESRLGFKYFFQTLRDSHYDPLCYSNDSVAISGFKDGELYQPKKFNAELEAEALLNYLDNTHQQRDPKKPFFITWSLNPPHNPWTEESTDMSFYSQYAPDGIVNLQQLLVRGNVDSVVGAYAPYYFANVSAVDHYIGLVLDKISELGLEDNTIIVFSSDHGEMLGSHHLKGKLKPESESFNIPFVVKWGSKLQHRIEDLMLSVPDIMPTLLGLAGLEEKIPKAVQGTNYAKILENSKDKTIEKPKAVLYLDYSSRGIYTGDYTFIVMQEKGEFTDAFLYNNQQDPYQLNKIPVENIDSTHLKSLKSDLYSLLVKTDDPWISDGTCMDFLLN